MTFLHGLKQFQFEENKRELNLHYSLKKIERNICKRVLINVHEMEKKQFGECSCENYRKCNLCISRDQAFTRSTDIEQQLEGAYEAGIKKVFNGLLNYSIKRIKLFKITKQVNMSSYDWKEINNYLLKFEDSINEVVEYSSFYVFAQQLQYYVDMATEYINVQLKYYSVQPIMIKESLLNKITGFGGDILDFLNNQCFHTEPKPFKPKEMTKEEHLREREEIKQDKHYEGVYHDRKRNAASKIIEEYQEKIKFKHSDITVKMNETIVASLKEGWDEIIGGEEQTTSVAELTSIAVRGEIETSET